MGRAVRGIREEEDMKDQGSNLSKASTGCKRAAVSPCRRLRLSAKRCRLSARLKATGRNYDPFCGGIVFVVGAPLKVLNVDDR